jgi:ubiquinone/menaquinone biosynthesis C-methylase UbiE
MNEYLSRLNEQDVARAFTGQSAVFDQIYAGNRIVSYKRERVRAQLIKYLKPGSRILELNAGTGEDAIFLAKQGHHVHATDISPGMLDKLKSKVDGLSLSDAVSSELCSFTSLENLRDKGPYDCIFSNFAGLNCTGNLEKVLKSFENLLKPGGLVLLVMLPGFCLWETLFIFKGKFKTAARRFFSLNGRRAKIDDAFFTCWYYSPSFIQKTMKNHFHLMELQGLCTIVPPSYVENFAEKYPKTFARLCTMEERLKNRWPWKYIGDYYIISLKRDQIA